ncbi:MAG: hypothetical protein ABSD20_07035 [Terriglobales bacterium]|jgi:hypothetical protein
MTDNMTDKKRTSSALRELEQLAAVSKEKNGMLRGKAEARVSDEARAILYGAIRAGKARELLATVPQFRGANADTMAWVEEQLIVHEKVFCHTGKMLADLTEVEVRVLTEEMGEKLRKIEERLETEKRALAAQRAGMVARKQPAEGVRA